MNNSYNPLVSLIVIAYNSSKYILDLLESAKAQTYKNIELIVSDDGSTDNTIDICRNWIETNKDRFVNTELIKVERNGGVSSNCNRGLKASKGEWVKLIAGDDILLNTCIDDCITYTRQVNANISALIGAGLAFIDKPSVSNLTGIMYDALFYNPEFSSKDQFKFLLKSNRPFAPGSFIKRKLLIDLGGFDENFRNIEDYPLWLKITKAGYKLYGLPKPIVYYRIHNESVFGSQYMNEIDKIVKDSYWTNKKIREEIIYPELNPIARFAMKQTYYRNRLLKKSGNSRKKFLCKIIVIFFNIFNLSRLFRL